MLAVLSSSGARATEYDLSTLTEVITFQDGDVLYGKQGKRYLSLKIAAGATITLRNAIIDFSSFDSELYLLPLQALGDCTIILEGTDNFLWGYNNHGILVEGKLTIKGDGTLVTKGGYNNDGICALKDVEILSGTVKAYGGTIGAGISINKGYSINISGGYVEARGVQHCAGIGGHTGEECGTVNIYGGEVYAYGGDGAPGIGRGEGNFTGIDGGTVNIYGGYVEAHGGEYGAGIGGSDGGDGGTITIYGGEVKAYGGVDGAGIGGGEGGASGTIKIYGGTVYAESTGDDSYGAGIGAGEDGDCDKVYISGGVIHAKGGELGHAVGTNKDVNTAVDFADDLVAWKDGERSTAANRSYFSCSNREVHINICDHYNGTFEDKGDGTHKVTKCDYCGLSGQAECHTAGADGKCTRCQTQVFAGSGTSGDPFLLTNATYPSFVRGIQYVGNFSGKYFQMTGDITTDKMANGTFSGTLDGNEHTVTLTLGNADGYLNQSCAMFNTLNGATIKNLRIAGSIYSSAKYNASIACSATGTNTIRDCVSSVSINSNKYGECTNGGFIGFITTASSCVNFEGCAFTGQLIGADATNWGGFIGWRDYSQCSATFTDCLFAPTAVNVDTSAYNSDSRTFCRSNSTDGASFTRCYYTTVLQAVDGGVKAVSTTTLPDDIGTEGTNYGFIQAYTNGLKCDERYYSSEHFSLPTNTITGTFAGNWCTYYNSASNLQVDDNTTIYTISAASGATATLHEVSGKIIKAGEGVILKSTGNITLTYTSAAATDADYTGNLLAGVDVTTTISSSAYADKVIYTLAKEDDDFGFFKYYDNVSDTKYTTNTTLGANKAFLPLDAAAAASARSFVFSLEGETTGIDTVQRSEVRGQSYYTLDGRKLNSKPSKAGLYIVNGKKIVIK